MKHRWLTSVLAITLVAGTAALAHADENAADNTGKNKRDVGAASTTLTPPDQSKGTKSDVEVTRKIRKALMADKSLSSKAHNVKIITLNGVATLRGPVENADEKSKVASIASGVTGGDASVTNQLEIKN